MLSLPPWLRYKVDNILVNFLFPDGLSAEGQKKFFDKIIETDFNPLFKEGIIVDGDRVQVQIFATVGVAQASNNIRQYPPASIALWVSVFKK